MNPVAAISMYKKIIKMSSIPINSVIICSQWQPFIKKKMFDFHRESQNPCVTV